MSFNLRNRSLLTVQDYTQREFRYLLDLARDLKRAKYARTEQKHLEGKEICLIFEKTSTRTRCAFEVACYDQGANVTYLDPAGSREMGQVMQCPPPRPRPSSAPRTVITSIPALRRSVFVWVLRS